MIRIAFDDMRHTFQEILQLHGFAQGKSTTCARIFAENSLDGVYSHGVNRFASFVEFVRQGYIHAERARGYCCRRVPISAIA